MRVTYYAVQNLMVGDQPRQAGDLVPEVAGWPYLTHYIEKGQVAPVLVVTLPQEVQDMLSEWEREQNGDEDPAEASEQESGAAPEGDGPTKEAAPVDVPVPSDTEDTDEKAPAPRSTRKDK